MSTQRTPPQQNNLSPLGTTPATISASDPQIFPSTMDTEASGRNDHVTRRFKRKLNEESTSDSSTMMDEMKSMFVNFETKQNSKFDKLMDSIIIIKDQNNDIQKSVDFLSTRYDELLQQLANMEQKNKSYEQKIEYLESKIELLERNSRSTTVEIKNIPRQPSENKSLLRSVVKKVGDVIGQPISDSDINDTYRLKTKNESTDHIIVNFTTTLHKDGFLRNTAAYNKAHKDTKLNTSHLQIHGPAKSVYINESLTQQGRKLAYLARQAAKANNYHSTWTYLGITYLKKTEDSPAVRIVNERDLDKLNTK